MMAVSLLCTDYLEMKLIKGLKNNRYAVCAESR